jgi:HTH-type transcriptional regulator / antitoxin HigA
METILRVIKNETEYKKALGAYESLFDVPDGSEEAETRDVLSLLIEKYEDEHYPMPLPDPIEAIKFRIEQEGLTQKDLVPFIGSKSKVSEVLTGKKELTLKMIRALNKNLGIPAEVLLNESNAALPDIAADWEFDKFPLPEMKKNGAFRGFKTADIRDKGEEAIRWLAEKAGGFSNLPLFAFRKTDDMRLSAKLNRYALMGWCLQVMAEAAEIESTVDFAKAKRKKSFIQDLVLLSVFEEGPKLAREYLLTAGIILHPVKHLKATYLDGATFYLPDGRPVIAVTLRYDRLDNFWFVVLHELGHLLLGHLSPEHRFFADDFALRGSNQDTDFERKADAFAENALLPENFDLHENEFLSSEEIIGYAKEHNVHPAIVAGRIQYERNNYKKFANLVGRGEVRKYFFEKE